MAVGAGLRYAHRRRSRRPARHPVVDALDAGRARLVPEPFFTTRLYHPLGTTLVFHTFDLPSTLLVLPLWGLLPEVAIYNTAVVFAFALTAYGMFRLTREVTGDVLCALLSGVLFAAVPYHFRPSAGAPPPHVDGLDPALRRPSSPHAVRGGPAPRRRARRSLPRPRLPGVLVPSAIRGSDQRAPACMGCPPPPRRLPVQTIPPPGPHPARNVDDRCRSAARRDGAGEGTRGDPRRARLTAILGRRIFLPLSEQNSNVVPHRRTDSPLGIRDR